MTEKQPMKKKITIDQKVRQALIDYKNPKYARQETGLSQQRFDKVLKDFDIPKDLGFIHEKLVGIAKIVFDDINKITKEAIPEKFDKKIAKCYTAYNGDDLIELVVKTTVDFSFEGFHAHADNEDDQKKLTAFNVKYNMDAVVLGLLTQVAITDSMLLGWRKKGETIDYVAVLNPRTHIVIPKDTVKKGKPQFEVWRLVETRPYAELEGIVQKKAKVGRPPRPKWVLVEKPEFAMVRSVDGDLDRMMLPSMTRIFPDYDLRRLIRDGDFTIYYHLKHMIHQIQVGDKANEDRPWMKIKIPGQVQLDNIRNEYKNSDKTMLEVTAANYTHLFVAPDPKYLDGVKYEPVEHRILRWGGILALYSKDQKYADGYLRIKALKAKLKRRRQIVTRMMQEFYREVLGIDKVSIMWNELNLLEPKQVLDRLKAAVDKGLSFKSFLEQLGFHPDLEDKQRAKEREHPENYIPPFEQGQGIVFGLLEKKGIIAGKAQDEQGEPGRPGDDKEEPREPAPSEE